MATNTLDWRRKRSQETSGIERRETPAVATMELREKDSATWALTGFACVTGIWYTVGWYEEYIAPGAFRRTLSQTPGPDTQLLVNHTGLPLARTRSGTMRLEERLTPDASGRTGLWVEADLDKLDPDAQRLERKMKRGDIDQMSFAFQVTSPGGWNDDYTRREITAVSIHRGDVSVVCMGANEAATATMRAADADPEPIEIPDYTTRARQEMDVMRWELARDAADTADALSMDERLRRIDLAQAAYRDRARQILAELRRGGGR